MNAVNLHPSKSKTTTGHAHLDELAAHASSPSLRQRVLDVFSRLESDRYLDETRRTYAETLANGMPYWDMCCALAAYADLHRPAAYLEIGVRRGRSASVVAAFHPDVSLYLFDMWHPDYAGEPNPGPAFVRTQLQRVGHRGSVRFIDGRSQETVPAFFQSGDAPAVFDLITVDGDHRDAGARADLENVIPRLAVGGMLVFDDIRHPLYPTLHDVWREFINAHPELTAHENPRDATGTAIALRIQ